MSALGFANGGIVTSDGVLASASVSVRDGLITGIEHGGRPAMAVDLDGGWIVPGFIDTQVNGGGGVLLNDDISVDAISTIAAAHRGFGTTGLLPTLISDELGAMVAALEAGEAAIEAAVPGVLGIHLEGPFLNPARRGVHEERHFRRLDPLVVEVLARPRRGKILVTLAPELCDPRDIRALVEAGVRVSAGHTNATYDEMMVAIGAGLDAVTHLYNAMSPLHHRDPGVVGAALDAGLWSGLIADGAHVHPAALRMAVRALPHDRIMLVTDAMASVGAVSKDFVLQGKPITVAEGVCSGPDGQLAGSDLDMAGAVRNMVRMTGITVEAASSMASTNPATFLGLSGERGVLKPGLRADWVWLDRDLAPVATWIGGERVQRN